MDAKQKLSQILADREASKKKIETDKLSVAKIQGVRLLMELKAKADADPVFAFLKAETNFDDEIPTLTFRDEQNGVALEISAAVTADYWDKFMIVTMIKPSCPWDDGSEAQWSGSASQSLKGDQSMFGIDGELTAILLRGYVDQENRSIGRRGIALRNIFKEALTESVTRGSVDAAHALFDTMRDEMTEEEKGSIRRLLSGAEQRLAEMAAKAERDLALQKAQHRRDELSLACGHIAERIANCNWEPFTVYRMQVAIVGADVDAKPIMETKTLWVTQPDPDEDGWYTELRHDGSRHLVRYNNIVSVEELNIIKKEGSPFTICLQMIDQETGHTEYGTFPATPAYLSETGGDLKLDWAGPRK